VERFFKDFLAKGIPLYSFTFNAGLRIRFVFSKDRIESKWQTNVLSQYYIIYENYSRHWEKKQNRINFLEGAWQREKTLFLSQWLCQRSEQIQQTVSIWYAIVFLEIWCLIGFLLMETECDNILVCRYLANELKNERIFVNCLHPGVAITTFPNEMVRKPLRGFVGWFFTSPEDSPQSQPIFRCHPTSWKQIIPGSISHQKPNYPNRQQHWRP